MSLSKIMLCPYFGPFPEWMDLWIADFMRTLKPQGYSLLLDTDLPAFKERVKDKLGIEFPGVRGGAKVWDYRGSLGVLYEEEIKGADFYGHVDFDTVFGNVNKWASDEVLSELDVYSGHNEYVNGSFSLYRNCKAVNNLFYTVPTWKMHMEDPTPRGWIEYDYSRGLELSGLRYAYTFNQGFPWTDKPILKKEEDNLFQEIEGEWKEIMFFHFRHSKQWPL